jgi:23S rRNA pseudoU1915 N3-methylase RlmH
MFDYCFSTYKKHFNFYKLKENKRKQKKTKENKRKQKKTKENKRKQKKTKENKRILLIKTQNPKPKTENLTYNIHK